MVQDIIDKVSKRGSDWEPCKKGGRQGGREGGREEGREGGIFGERDVNDRNNKKP